MASASPRPAVAWRPWWGAGQTSCTQQAAESVALACLELLTDEPRWIHRRVETIDLLAQELVRRQVTVDFTLPESRCGRPADRRRADRGACRSRSSRSGRCATSTCARMTSGGSILGAGSGGPVAAGLVTAAARLAIAPEGARASRSRARLELHRPQRAGGGARGDGRAAPVTPSARRSDRDGSSTMTTSAYFLATFAGATCSSRCSTTAGGRRILKYAYDEHLSFGDERRGPRRLARRLGWSPFVDRRRRADRGARGLLPRRGRRAGGAAAGCDGSSTSAPTSCSRRTSSAASTARRCTRRASPLDAEPVLVAAISA